VLEGRTVDRGLIFRFYFWKDVVVDIIASTTNRKEAVVYRQGESTSQLAKDTGPRHRCISACKSPGQRKLFVLLFPSIDLHAGGRALDHEA
jgi:hypothetical protein